MNRHYVFFLFLGILLVPSRIVAEIPSKPNVLFIAIDDLRDWTGYLHTHPQVKTPSLDRIASKGVAFERAYCAAPSCNPSRAALMTGLRPSTTGVYDNDDDWRKIVPESVILLQEHFQRHGYYTAGSGKIYHGSYETGRGWDDYHVTDRALISNSRKASKRKPGQDDDEYWDGVGGIKFMPLDCTDEEMEDYHVVNYAIEQLGRKHDKPFFLACGVRKPHMPWNVPRKYYDMYPLDKIELPTVDPNDLDDIPPAGIAMARPKGDHAAILKSGRWKNAVQGYLATITFCDAMIGRLWDAFEKSEYRDNTIVVLWSDHGWHLGEKQHWRKFALWEEATRAPLIWNVPGLTKPGTTWSKPVDYMHIYPTLCDLAGLPMPEHRLDGSGIRDILSNPASTKETVALTNYRFRNHAVRTSDWRYIRYANGDEELYDEKTDPGEWKNRAADPEMISVKKELADFMPKTDAPGRVKEKPAKNQTSKK